MSDFSTNTGSASGALTAFFDTRSEAEVATSRLRDAGIADSAIRLTEGSSADSSTGMATSSGTQSGDNRGFFESLGDFFFPDDDRAAYAEGLSRGGFLLTITGISDVQQDAAMDILEDAGAVDIDEREQSWRSEGWSGYNDDLRSGDYVSGSAGVLGETTATSGNAGFVGESTATSGLSGRETVAGMGGQTGFPDAGVAGTLRDDETVQVVREDLRVGKRDTSAGRVRVRSYVVEQPVSESVTLNEERVTIDRRPVDRPVTAGDAAFQDRTLEAEERREEAVISKEARVVEEIGLRREHESHTETVQDTVRHTEVEIDDERVTGSTTGAGLGGSDLDRR